MTESKVNEELAMLQPHGAGFSMYTDKGFDPDTHVIVAHHGPDVTAAEKEENDMMKHSRVSEGKRLRFLFHIDCS